MSRASGSPARTRSVGARSRTPADVSRTPDRTPAPASRTKPSRDGVRPRLGRAAAEEAHDGLGRRGRAPSDGREEADRPVVSLALEDVRERVVEEAVVRLERALARLGALRGRETPVARVPRAAEQARRRREPGEDERRDVVRPRGQRSERRADDAEVARRRGERLAPVRTVGQAVRRERARERPVEVVRRDAEERGRAVRPRRGRAASTRSSPAKKRSVAQRTGPFPAGDEHGQFRTAASWPRATRISQNVRLRRRAPSSRTQRPNGGTRRPSPGTTGSTRNVPESASRRKADDDAVLGGLLSRRRGRPERRAVVRGERRERPRGALREEARERRERPLGRERVRRSHDTPSIPMTRRLRRAARGRGSGLASGARSGARRPASGATRRRTRTAATGPERRAAPGGEEEQERAARRARARRRRAPAGRPRGRKSAVARRWTSTNAAARASRSARSTVDARVAGRLPQRGERREERGAERPEDGDRAQDGERRRAGPGSARSRTSAAATPASAPARTKGNARRRSSI